MTTAITYALKKAVCPMTTLTNTGYARETIKKLTVPLSTCLRGS